MRQSSGSLNVLRSLPSPLHRPMPSPVDHYLGPIFADGPGSEIIGARVEQSFGRGRGSSPASRYPLPNDPLAVVSSARPRCGSVVSSGMVYLSGGYFARESSGQAVMGSSR